MDSSEKRNLDLLKEILKTSTGEDPTTKIVVVGADEEGRVILLTFNASAGDVYSMLNCTYQEILKIISKDAPAKEMFN